MSILLQITDNDVAGWAQVWVEIVMALYSAATLTYLARYDYRKAVVKRFQVEDA